MLHRVYLRYFEFIELKCEKREKKRKSCVKADRDADVRAVDSSLSVENCLHETSEAKHDIQPLCFFEPSASAHVQ